MSIESITTEQYKQYQKIKQKEKEIQGLNGSRSSERNFAIYMDVVSAILFLIGTTDVIYNGFGDFGSGFLVGSGAFAFSSLVEWSNAKYNKKQIQEETTVLEEMKKNLSPAYEKMEELNKQVQDSDDGD